MEAARAREAESLDQPLEPDDAGLARRNTVSCAEPGFEGVLDRDALRAALAGLTGRERLAVALRFFGELSQSEIAKRLGV
jgi:RNA polymerase sigma-B factor